MEIHRHEIDSEKHVGKAQGERNQNLTSGSMLLIKKAIANIIRRDTGLKIGEQIRRELQCLYIRQASRPLRNSRSVGRKTDVGKIAKMKMTNVRKHSNFNHF